MTTDEPRYLPSDGDALMAPRSPILPLYATQSAIPVKDSSYVVDDGTEHIKALILQEFPNDRYMLDIAKCESGFRQFRSENIVLTGGMNNHFIGIFQENISWESTANAMGFSIYTTEGNIRLAHYLLSTYGKSQWQCAG